MANYANLLAAIAANVYQNGNNEVAANMVKAALNNMVASLGEGFQLKAVATPDTDPGTPDARIYYLAWEPGVYTNFDSITVDEGEFVILYHSDQWRKRALDITTTATAEDMDGRILDNKFIGDGQTYANKRIYGLVPGRRYRVALVSTTWDTTGITGDNIYVFIVRNHFNGTYTKLATALFGSDVAPYYDITVPANSEYIEIGGRAVYGVVVRFTILDITDAHEAELAATTKDLYIGKLVQQGYSAAGLVDGENPQRVAMQDVIAFPYLEATFTVKMPDNYWFGIRCGAVAIDLSTHYYWFGNGDEFTIQADRLFYRICFGKGTINGNPYHGTLIAEVVTVEEIQALIDAGAIRITYKNTHDVIKENIDSEKYVRAMMRQFYHDGINVNKNGLMPNMAIFGHTSDVHGDAKRYDQFLEYCDHIGVDAALVSGDMVASNPGNYMKFINVLADKHTSMVLPCIGNHDARGLYTAQEQNEQLIGYLMDKNDVEVNGQETYPTYYYKDFPDKNVRLIVLNTHELERADTDGCNLTTKQMNWFIGVLAATPVNYGILVMFHEPETTVIKDNAHPEFYQPYHTHTLIFQDGITGSPISKIIDAFISRASATITYTSQGEERSVSADFTAVDESIDFVAYVIGHEHIDWIGVLDGTVNRQLVLDIACGIALYGQTYKLYANLCDIPRGGELVTQDAFNIYGIDLASKTVRVARIGSNITPEGLDRKFMIIPYKTV